MTIHSIEGFRLSPQQSLLWRVQQMVSTLPFKAQCTITISGVLDPTLLQLALTRVVMRHEILRTTFQTVPGMTVPLQVISSAAVEWHPPMDLTEAPVEMQGSLLISQAATLCQMTIDLVHGPIVHAQVITSTPTQHTLLLSMPSLCADLLSLGVLLRDICHTYTNIQTSGNDEDEPLQYADLAETLSEILESDETVAGRVYWQQLELARFLPMALPFILQPTLSLPFAPAAQRIDIDPSQAIQLATIAHAHGATPAAGLLASWVALLHRLSGQTDLLLGLTCDGRSYDGMGDTCGLFAKAVPLHIHLTADSRFYTLLHHVNQAVQSAYEWQESFAWSVVPDLAAVAGNPPYFPVGFEFYTVPDPIWEGDLRFALDQLYACSEPFQLKLTCIQRYDMLDLTLHYDPAVISADTVQRLASQLQTLLAAITSTPDIPLATCPILSASEQEQLLITWNQTSTPQPPYPCLHTWFTAQASYTPDAIAISCGDAQLTFAVLDQRANQLAHCLQQRGIHPDAVVALCLERSIDLLVAIFGVLKAGGAYLPLDPTLPTERLAFLLADSQATLILTNQSLSANLPASTAPLFLLDCASATLAQAPSSPPLSQVQTEHIAYVLYTSGSTGTPKGVLVPHRGLVNYLHWATTAYAVADGGGAPIHSPIGFDLTVTSLFTPLLVGRCVQLLPEGSGIETLLTALEHAYDWSLIKLTPAHLEALNQFLPSTAAGCARTLVIGGEALWGEHLLFWRTHAPAMKLINEYGPTETVVGCCTYTVPAEGVLTGPVPIGRPIANTQIYLLDVHSQPVPIGVPGEMYIGGAGVARGYLGRPDLTAERFVPDPFSRTPGARLYQTGDLARYQPDGTLVYLGRCDQQVKVRGARVELGEVEAALNRHSLVREAVVVAQHRVEPVKDTYLVAYVVPQPETTLDPLQVQHMLRQWLPEYMLPARIVPMAQLPLTPNGKVDRAALTLITESPSQIGYEAPRDPLEEIVAGVWGQVLGIEAIGIHQNFFSLGGHSLLATQVVSRLREVCQVELGVRALFETPTVAGIAAQIEQARQIISGITAPALVCVERNEPLPLSFGQRRLWFLSQLEPGNPAYNSLATLQLTGRLNVTALQQSLDTLVQRHEVLRTSFTMLDGEPMQLIGASTGLPITFEDLTALPEIERDRIVRQRARAEALQPFDLTRGPLLRVTLLRLAIDDHIVLFAIHHIVSDGWSMGVLIRELTIAYEAYIRGEPVQLPKLPYQYADYAMWQREWMSGSVLEAQLAYWTTQLADVPTRLLLPTNRPHPSIRTSKGITHIRWLPRSLTENLRHLSQREGATLFMTLLTAFQTLLYRYSGQTDVIVGSPIAGRNQVEIEGLIGFFVNTLVLRTELSGNPTFRELLKRVRQVALDAYAHQDLPFERLVEAIRLERDINSTPLFQVMFILQNAPVEEPVFSELEMKHLDNPKETAKFALTLSTTDTEDGLVTMWEFSTDLFEVETIERIACQWQTLLEGVISNPEQRITQLPLMTESERKQMLIEWNASQANYSHTMCIHEIFEAQVEQTPDAIALIFQEQQLSYRELNCRANYLAHHIKTFGVGPESMVGIFMERSLELVIGILAILKAGGAYVPLDPTYPSERLRFMLEDSHASVLLTQQHLVAWLPAHQAQVVCVDMETEITGSEYEDNLITTVSLDSPSYIIYTSGSTGYPKGVIGLHRGAINRFRWMWSAFPFTVADRCCQKTSISFVDSVWEIFGPLLQGISNVIIPETVVKRPQQFLQLMAEYNVTRIVLVPSLLREILDINVNLATYLQPLRMCITSGESLPVELARSFHENLPDRLLLNLYGSSEVSADVTYYDTQQLDNTLANVAIGRPIANTQIYLLDVHGQPAPIGVPGEIYVGGANVARGYLNSQELTAEKFVPNPFSDMPGTRLYRTGDLGCYRSDGTIDFLGRVDDVVKIRGFRINPEEIESTLLQHPSIHEAVVLAHQDTSNDSNLVAYVVPHEQKRLLHDAKDLQFSLFYFAADNTSSAGNLYRLYLEGAKLADRLGFTAIWTPERHFTEVGAPYPNPSVLSSALAVVTEQIKLRAGSVVLPLHHPIRVTEEWAIVDQLSRGRVGLSFTSGWVPNDFVFAPDHFADKRDIMLQQIQEVQQLWRGEAIVARNGVGQDIPVKIFPRPIQPELPVWLTCTGHPQMFVKAGELGVNVLTALLSQTIEEAAANIARYRESLARHGHDPKKGHVTIMLHTFVGDEDKDIREKVQEPLWNYLRQHTNLVETVIRELGIQVDLEQNPEVVKDQVAAFAFERYFQTASLIGTPGKCSHMIQRLKAIGVDEVACLIDFGVNVDAVLESLHNLAALKEQSRQATSIDTSTLRYFLQGKLPQHMIPTGYVLLDTLPRTPNGKIDRRKLPIPDRNAMVQGKTIVAPRDTLELQLTQIWEELLNTQPIGITDNFFDLGGHSLIAIRLIARIQQLFNQELPLAQIFRSATIEQIAALLRQQAAPMLRSPLIAMQPKGTRRPFFCIHPVGGTVLRYVDLAHSLDPNRPFYALQSPGLDQYQQPLTRIEDMAAQYLATIESVQPEGPYLLGGWSMGGIVAFEMARQLRHKNQEVALLAVFESFSPIMDNKLTNEEMLLAEIARMYNLPITTDELRSLEADQQLSYILDRAVRAKLIPPDTDIAQIRRYITTTKVNMQAVQNYVPQFYPKQLTLFQATEKSLEDLHDSSITRENLPAAELQMYYVPGNHHTMLDMPNVQVLASQLRACIENAEALVERP